MLTATAENGELDFEKIGRWGTMGDPPPGLIQFDKTTMLQRFHISDRQQRQYSEYKVSTPEKACKLANERYLDVTGTKLRSDEILSVTDLRFWRRSKPIPGVGNNSYAWCVSVLRIDGETQYPRVSNRLWIDAYSEKIASMIPKGHQNEFRISSLPSTADGNLIPMLAKPQEKSDNLLKLKAKLKNSKVPFPESVLEMQKKRAAAAKCQPPGLARVAVACLIALGRDIEGFGVDGDLIWIVQSDFGGSSFSKEEWINSRTGKTLEFSTESWSKNEAAEESVENKKIKEEDQTSRENGDSDGLKFGP